MQPELTASFGVGEDWLLPSDFHAAGAEAPQELAHLGVGPLEDADFALSPQLPSLGGQQTLDWNLATPYGGTPPLATFTAPPQPSPQQPSPAKRKFAENGIATCVVAGLAEPPTSSDSRERHIKQRVAATSAPSEANGKPLRDTTSPPDDLSPDEPGDAARDQVVHFRSRAVEHGEDQTIASKPSKQRPAANETRRPAPSATHRSTFAQRFFADMVAGDLSAFNHNGPHRVTVLQDVGGPNASWRPKHQLPSK